LFVTGRDIAPEQELPLFFDHTTGWWRLSDEESQDVPQQDDLHISTKERKQRS